MPLSRSRLSNFFASAVLAPLAALTLGSVPARADSISTHGTICNPYGKFPAEDLLYTESGVWNVSTVTRSVICSIPRVPVGGGGQTFIVEGTSTPNQTTSCSIRSFSSTGVGLTAKGFTFTGSTFSMTYSRVLPFSAAELPNFAYAMMICTLTPGGGHVRGVQALNTTTQASAAVGVR